MLGLSPLAVVDRTSHIPPAWTLLGVIALLGHAVGYSYVYVATSLATIFSVVRAAGPRLSSAIARCKPIVPPAWTPLGVIALLGHGLGHSCKPIATVTAGIVLIGAQIVPDPLTLIIAPTTLTRPGWVMRNTVTDTTSPRLNAHVAFEDRLTIADPSEIAGERSARIGDYVARLQPFLRDEPAGDALCLTRAVYFEARGESLEGQLAVAQVVLNRYADPRFPKSICGVVYEHHFGAPAHACQFSFACDTIPDVVTDIRAWSTAKAIAFLANSRRLPDVTGGQATHYHASWVLPLWAKVIEEKRTLGNHIFYREG